MAVAAFVGTGGFLCN